MKNLSPSKLKKALLDIQATHNLSQEAVLQLEKEILAGRTQELLDFKHTPVDIETFLTDPHFLFNECKDSWSKPIDSTIEIMSGNYSEIILTGATGVSKNTRANWMQAYNLYYLSCLNNPAHYCNLLESSTIYMWMINRTHQSAKDITFAKFKSLVDTIPYFKDYFKYSSDFTSRLVFPNNVTVAYTTAAPDSEMMGSDTICSTLDEVGYMERTEKSKKTADGKDYDQAKDTYNSLKTRIAGRFMTTKKIPSQLHVISSRSSDTDFTAWRLAQLEKESGEKIQHEHGYSKGKTFVSEFSQWEVKPKVNKDGSVRYGGKTFFFGVGNGKHPSEVINNPKSENEVKGRDVLEIPVEHKLQFESDPERSLLDIAGVASSASGRYFGSYMKSVYASTEDYTNGKYEPVFAEYDSPIDTWDLDLGFPEINPKYMVLNAHVPRFAHFDLSVSGDTCGFTISYSPSDMPLFKEHSHDMELKPKIIVESVIGILPPNREGGQISFERLRALLYYLKESVGIPIKFVSFDGFNSIDFMQILQQNLFETAQVSVHGINSVAAYETLRTAFSENIISMPPNALLLKEIRELVYFPKGRGRVDHTATGSNDLSDSLASTLKYMLDKFEKNELYEWNNMEVLSLYV